MIRLYKYSDTAVFSDFDDSVLLELGTIVDTDSNKVTISGEEYLYGSALPNIQQIDSNPFYKSVLNALESLKTGLDSVAVSIGSIGSGSTSTQRASAKTTVTASGSVVAGKQSVTFVTSADFVGSILGDTAKAGAAYTFAANGSDTLAEIAYVITTGSMEILTIV